jgi:peptide-methionine (S)-S-oxide reductase
MQNRLMRWSCVPLAASLLALLVMAVPRGQAEPAHAIPPPTLDEPPSQATSETTVLAGGCFWGVQGVFQHLDGVISAVSGYAGGAATTAHYETVSNGTTGHAESVRVTFDPLRISYGQILQVFFSVALDPTEVNRQGPGSGTQYRSVLFTTTPEQERVAKAYIAQLDQVHAFPAPIATRVDPGRAFYPAEGYHQNFLAQHPDNPYIAAWDRPKIAALQHLFPSQYRAQPVLVASAAD